MASILFIQQFIKSQARVVAYDPNGKEGFKAACPVCAFCGFEPGRIFVMCTMGDIRYCECSQCLADFRAQGPTAAEIKAEKEATKAAVSVIEKQIKKSKKRKK